MKEARAGFYPAKAAAAELERLFVDAVTAGANVRSEAQARDEWAGILAWAVAQANAADLNQVRARVAERMPPNPDPSDLVAPSLRSEAAPVGAPINLPDDFWSARPALTHISTAARARTRSRDALLGAVLARIIAVTPPTLTLPAIVGAAGSLNLAVAITGPSGAGKSSVYRTAGDLVPIEPADDLLADVPLGSGEGLAELFFGQVKEPDDEGKPQKVRRQTRRRALIYLDEGQALGEMGERKGSTLLPTIRSAWTGDTLGQMNASENTRRPLAAGSYRLCLVIGFQPASAAALLSDAGGGTPQRFLWLSATDPTIPDERPDWPGPLLWTPPPERAYAGQPFTTEMGVDDEAAAEIRRNGLARARGEAPEGLDSHHDLSRLKVGAALAILDGREDVNAEDWQLAQAVLDTSRAVRSSLVAIAREASAASEHAGHARAARREIHVTETKAEVAVSRMAKVIAKHVHKARCDGPCKRRCCQQATASTDRKQATVDEALDRAEAEGWIVTTDDGVRPGDTKPA